MEKAELAKLRQMLQSIDPDSVLLGLQLVQTFDLEEVLLTEICFVAYFSSIVGKAEEIAQDIFQSHTPVDLHYQLASYPGYFNLATEIGHLLDELDDIELFMIINKVRFLQMYLHRYDFFPEQVLSLLVEHDLDLSQFDFPKTMTKIHTSILQRKIPIHRIGHYFPALTQLQIGKKDNKDLDQLIDFFNQLLELHIEADHLESFPKAVLGAKSLQTLSLTQGQFTTLPDEIATLYNLEELSVKNGNLNALPESIGKLSKLKRLDVGGNQLETLPEAITHLTQMTHLGLAQNKLLTLPKDVDNLPNLTELKLSFNHLQALPLTITKLTKLTSLDLRCNQLHALPATIGQLQSLTNLFMSNNQLKDLPESMQDLTNLNILQLSRNQLTQIPEGISRLKGLQFLYISGNPITQLPETIAELSNLIGLKLAGLKLTHIPDFIFNLPKLETLFFNHNLLTKVPTKLKQLKVDVLNLSYNQLEDFPADCVNTQSLEELYLKGNPIYEIKIKRLRKQLPQVEIIF
ncbi:MAG TPA: hypothetical protein DCS93_15505 [Microscillaceae bacterium]|nr:hypothetical protein [Microscillaceae bacterium]